MLQYFPHNPLNSVQKCKIIIDQENDYIVSVLQSHLNPYQSVHHRLNKKA